ncbi:class I SAM-dependent rRNA methyltransferase [Peredibacter starrii]|uniref:Class I SAM-dependent methyltransferase n=1 Tax=Peredibacter starrii TaxID=28202 RepID=A0AAX4HQ98_9BACT|nr:class I SAM-dependent methyltransferase [Peredibacter starrii]WPU65518.1 class I SAM-dependent methyltransferase [Peredibacter starrii]
MRSIVLSKSGINKVRSHSTELKAADFEGSIKSVPPGEWCQFQLSPTEFYVGFINPMIEEKYTCAYLVGKVTAEELKTFSPDKFVSAQIKKAFDKRQRYETYHSGARLFYGMSDGLPGLIVDSFENASIIQINTAGVDKFRDQIKSTLETLTGTKGYFLDNPKYREKEYLPTFETEKFPDLDVIENGLRYKIRSEVLQKVGFYYDHRENRFQLMSLLKRLSHKPKRGVDLFSYAGAWGMSALSGGVERVEFVDQGDFAVEVAEALKINGFADRGAFHRQDVFKYLDEMINKQTKFDLVLCDPPAFAKSASQKDQALEGYSKLHRKVLKCAAAGSICAFSSCTHYVGHDEFQKNVMDAARKEGRKVQLIYSGMQGWDHPVTSLEDKSNYIKSYFYFVE